MLLNLSHHIRNPSDLGLVSHKGVVVDDNDPKQMGRVKCLVEGRFQVTVDKYNRLPWIMPYSTKISGGKPDLDQFVVPEKYSEVRVYFLNDDPYCAYYDGAWNSSNHHTNEVLNANYPKTYGWVDSIIQWFTVNKLKRLLTYFRKDTKDFLELDKEGNLKINIPKDLLIDIGGDIDIETNKMTVKSSKSINLKSGTNINLKSSNVLALKHAIIVTDAPIDGLVFLGGTSFSPPPEGVDSELNGNVTELENKIQVLQDKLIALQELAISIKERADPFNKILVDKGTDGW
jgi:hypothetical protein